MFSEEKLYNLFETLLDNGEVIEPDKKIKCKECHKSDFDYLEGLTGLDQRVSFVAKCNLCGRYKFMDFNLKDVD